MGTRSRSRRPAHDEGAGGDMMATNRFGEAPIFLATARRQREVERVFNPPDTDLDASKRFGGLMCSPADRMALHLRALGKPFGLVTNGERWMLVHAPVGQVSGFASWYARLWGQEPETLRAFCSLLGARRFFVPEDERLAAFYERSLSHQDEVTDALGEQVRRAVEVLIQALDRADQDRNRELLRRRHQPAHAWPQMADGQRVCAADQRVADRQPGQHRRHRRHVRGPPR